MYQYEKSRKAQLHENLFSWFWGIGAYTNKRKMHFVRTNALLAN